MPTSSANNVNVSMFHVAKSILKERYLPDLFNLQIYLSFATLRIAGNEHAI